MDDLACLALQLEWGADEALDLVTINRFQAVVAAVPEGAPLQTVAPRAAPPPMAPVPQASAVEQAAMLAAEAGSVEELRAAVAGFEGCALRFTASNLVFAEGPADAGILVVGEPPSRDEDRSGHPFAGADGELLDAMLISIGLSRREMLLTPVLPWRPPGGRPASPQEIAMCLPFLDRLVGLVKPARVVTFGPRAAGALLPAGRGRRRGAPGWEEIAPRGGVGPLPLLCLPGLADIAKTPAARKDAWAGLRLLRRAVDAG